ncbi:MAG: M23 family metallopeptidase [Zoogloeaceae bacterium]|jgi:murein DD-endopeptidase MepM/ murein hydrolase activator NlpD|nr:M23 family metallopeptidase [Zoogloeaceae bacterium]
MMKQNIVQSIVNHLPGFPEAPRRLLAVAGVFVLSMVTALAFTHQPEYPEGHIEVVEALNLPAGEPLDQGDEIYVREERIIRGEQLDHLLVRLGVTDNDSRKYVLRAPETQILHRQIVPGRVVEARVRADGSLLRLYFPLNGGENGMVVEEWDGRLTAYESARKYETRQVMKSGEIRYSLFGATDEVGIPDNIAIQMAEIFSGDIDFHRDLRQGDRFSLIYEMRYLHGKPAGAGRILAVEFTNVGKTHQAFYFMHKDGSGHYYNARGERLKKAFLRSPLEFSRVTSGFSLRFHPILKTWREHKGVDYGAPTGTPVRATGDGVVQFIGPRGGYGNLVVLSHAGHYQTAYAHLSRFASLKQGSRVSQGDTIGYVGSTGWSTGPHLHYEFRVQGQPINPLSIKLPTSIPLTPAQKIEFQRESAELQARIALLKDMPVARFE